MAKASPEALASAAGAIPAHRSYRAGNTSLDGGSAALPRWGGGQSTVVVDACVARCWRRHRALHEVCIAGWPAPTNEMATQNRRPQNSLSDLSAAATIQPNPSGNTENEGLCELYCRRGVTVAERHSCRPARTFRGAPLGQGVG